MAYNAAMYQNPVNQVQPFYPGSNIVGQSNLGQMFPQQQQPPMYNMGNMPYTLTATYVQGEIGARSYLVAAGNTVILLDSDTIDTDKPIIYIKTTGHDGKPLSLKKIEGTVSYPNEQGLFNVQNQEVKQTEIDLSDYIKKEDIESYQTKIDSINQRLDTFDVTVGNLNESLTNIDNRFTNMFNAFNSNNSSGKSPDTLPKVSGSVSVANIEKK